MHARPLLLALLLGTSACARPTRAPPDGGEPTASTEPDCDELPSLWPEQLARDADEVLLLSPRPDDGRLMATLDGREHQAEKGAGLPVSSWTYAGGRAFAALLRPRQLGIGDAVAIWFAQEHAHPWQRRLVVADDAERPHWERAPEAHPIVHPHVWPGVQLDLWLSPDASDQLLVEVTLHRLDGQAPEQKTYVRAHRTRMAGAHGALLQARPCPSEQAIAPGAAYEATLVAIDEWGHVAPAPAPVRFYVSTLGTPARGG